VKTYAVVVTGASGSVYGLRLVEQLVSAGHTVILTVTGSGREVMAAETGFRLPDSAVDASRALLDFLELRPTDALVVASPADLPGTAAGLAGVEATIACPASMGFCASVAAGLTTTGPEKTADTMLKEGRPLLLVPRETPFSLVHLRNLTALAESGATVIPASPGFTPRPASIDDLVDYVVARVLDVLGIGHQLARYPGK
jgi:4-hydroxy-3-polyprenylbenzoate decarboxylase